MVEDLLLKGRRNQMEKAELLIDQDGRQFRGALLDPWLPTGRRERFGILRCTNCKQNRTMDLLWQGKTSALAGGGLRLIFPGLGLFSCRECDTLHPAGIWCDASDPNVTIFRFGSVVSVATPHTPKSVTYYLHQAAQAKGSGARSASAAMFRAALENVLFEQGFKAGMLHAKIDALEKRLTSGDAPPWARDLDPEELKALKNLGNGAIHPNDGDVDRQAAIDDSVLESVELLFEHLLDKIYEEPIRKADRLQRLSKAAEKLNKRPSQ